MFLINSTDHFKYIYLWTSIIYTKNKKYLYVHHKYIFSVFRLVCFLQSSMIFYKNQKDKLFNVHRLFIKNIFDKEIYV